MSSFSHSHRSLDFVIPGDQLEQDRRNLEHNLKNYDPDFSPASSDRYLSDSHSIEQGRRTSGPIPNDFASFEHPSFDQFDPGDRSRVHAWSYRSDDEGIVPYGGETMSTAAHHASALTFSAGLGRRGGRRDVSISGAEFDPERPLSEMIANVRDKFSFLEASKSKSKLNVEPLVVEDTGEIDRILNSGYSLAQENLSARLRRTGPPTTSSSSETDSPARPKLSQALDRVSFSPRRPRSTPARPSHRQVDQEATPVASRQQPHSHGRKASQPVVHDTPRAQQRRLPSAMATPQSKSHSQATPQSSKFTKMARGINQDIEFERSSRNVRPTPDSVQRKRTVNFDLSRQSAALNQEASFLRSRVHLPDFTGLTSAVESPARVRVQHRSYHGRPQKGDDLLPSLDALHKKLLSLETENSISRRRVMELEMELRSSQQETKMREQQPVEVRSAGRAGRAVQADMSQRADAEEAQKALEALVNTLRGHLTRLTSELSSQRELLVELREQREADRDHSRDKSLEIEQLKAEVERLAGEVEVLRGVVEEGLKETRAATRRRPQSADKSFEVQNEAVDRSFSQAGDDEEDEQEPVQVPSPHIPTVRVSSPTLSSSPRMTAQEVLARSMSFSRSSTPVGNNRALSPPPRAPSSRAPSVQSRSSSPARSTRSNRSRRDGREDTSFILHARPPSVIEHEESEVDESEKEEAEESDHENTISYANITSRYEPGNISRPARPSAPTPSHAANNHTTRRVSSSSHQSHASHRRSPSPSSDPFPRIRGHRMEQMFFAAREHDSSKCTTCRRRYQPAREEGAEAVPPWLFKKTRQSHQQAANEDEGFVEGTNSPPLANRREKAGAGSLPPQTVLSKVLRELEDDFSHYKSIYVEMADQYKFLDAVSDVPRRKALARHLHDIIELLEQKGDQITALYDVLKFEDKPVAI